MTGRHVAGSRAGTLLGRLAALRRDGIVQTAPIADAGGAIDGDHPLVRAVGAERAAKLLNGSADASVRALDQRRIVEAMSREGGLVRDIAAATNLSERHVVRIRQELGVGRYR